MAQDHASRAAPADGVDSRLVAIFREVFADPHLALRRDLTPDTLPHWDSIRTMSVLMTLEERFGLTLRAAQIRALRSVGDIEGLLPPHDG